MKFIAEKTLENIPSGVKYLIVKGKHNLTPLYFNQDIKYIHISHKIYDPQELLVILKTMRNLKYLITDDFLSYSIENFLYILRNEIILNFKIINYEQSK